MHACVDAGCAVGHRNLPLHTKSGCTMPRGFKVDQECFGMLDGIQGAIPLGPLACLEKTTSF